MSLTATLPSSSEHDLISFRNYNIVNLRKKGFTLQSLANEYNITREAVRQICEKNKNCYDKNFVVTKHNTPVKILNSKNRIFYDGKFWSYRGFLRHYFPKKSLNELENIRVSIRAYAKRENKNFQKCLIQYVKTKENFWSKKKFFYKGKEYKNQFELYNKLFPDVNPADIYHAIRQRMRWHNISIEEAIEMTVEKGYPSRA